ncbi:MULTISPECIES: hypothetical protein [unclassified Delftia]|uniref:hypothetical protein n=1 Tax=unclassified Delftia TaxID=2613839 RepID=UPI001901F5AC|nr:MULTISPECIES: hypothetical protein [unclassified Delftia]MBK0115637.1 hypothetical protein [Delftia sp. S65]MBK0119506.1 hypothetical protein [Delftia sp. S67]MBK0130190.1 hypothetical protein [Delftia sp. S66]
MFGFHPDKKAPPAPQPKLGFRPRGQQQSAALAQAQNQAPDSIPAMVKPGEFVLPPDTVHAMGGAGALQAAVDATHTPSAAAPKVPRGFKPEVFFDAGGDVEEQRRRQSLNSPGSTFPGSRLQGDSGSSGMPSTQAARIAAQPTVAPAPAADKVGGFGYQQNNQEVGQSIKDSWNQGNYGEAVGKTVAGTVGMVTTPIIDLAARGTSAAWDGAKGFGRGLVGADDSPQAPNAAPAAVKASAPAVTPGAGATAAARTAAPSSSFSAVNEYSQAPSTGGPPTAGQASQVSPGVFRSGNSYGDSEQAAILGAEPRGLPSWRNQNAANNLAGQQQAESMGRVQAAMAPPPTSPVQRVAIMGSGDARGFRRASNLRASDRGDLARLQEAQRYDTRLGFAAGQQQLERDRIAADTFRTARGFNVDQQRLDTERRLADSEITARGFKSRAQQQEERLRNTFLDPNATPQQRQQAQQSLRAISGEAEQSPWKVTVTPATKNADGSTTQGSIIRHNGVTGEVQQVDGGGAAQPSANHIAALRANPGQAALFDEIYGKGAAARIVASR